MKKWIITLVALIVIAFIIYFWVRSSDHKTPPRLVTVKARTIKSTVTAVGNIVPKHIITVRSALDGLVVTLSRNVGDQVKKGETLARIGPNVKPVVLAEAISNVDQYKGMVSSDKRQVANDLYLIRNKIVNKSYSTYLSDLSSLKADRAKLRYYRQSLGLVKEGKATIDGKLEQGQVVSPINGSVLQRNVDIGDSVISVSSNQSATTLFTIADMSDLMFKGSVDEIDANKIHVGMPAKIRVGALPEEGVSGELERLGLQSDEQNDQYTTTNTSSTSNTNTPFNVGFEVEVGKFKLQKKVTLRSGFSATAVFVTKQVKNAASLPESAIDFSKDKPTVTVLDGEDGGTKDVTVVVGVTDGTYIQIVSGLKVGDQVVDKVGSKQSS